MRLELVVYYDSDGRFVYIAGMIESEDYTIELSGGKVYYLYAGYRKDQSNDGKGEDRFAIEDITLTKK